MGLSTAERNRRKRERKKQEKEERRKQEVEEVKVKKQSITEEDVEIEYITEEVNLPHHEMEAILQKFQERAAVSTTMATDNDDTRAKNVSDDEGSDNDGGDDDKNWSKRKLREVLRPSVADLKRRVERADLVEAHDVTAPDPEFLIKLKGLAGTVPVPRHWGRKRKYLQGKRGFEKPPFQLPDFIMKTGIAELRDTVAENEASMSAKQMNRSRVAPKMGAMDVDYRTLHDAFFKHQTKPTNLTKQGDLYYEGKELETKNRMQPGKPLSEKLREALGMTTDNMPPPWLVNMQRYGPPPSYPALKTPGLNAPLPSTDCQYGYHVGGWGKPPVDNYGRPLYGGNPFDAPGDAAADSIPKEGLVTSDGKTLLAKEWGSLPMGVIGESDEESEEEMEESSDEESDEEQEEKLEEEKEEGEERDGVLSVLPAPVKAAPTDLRKDGLETPVQKQLYTVLEEKKTGHGQQVFGSEVQYVVPGGGAESVLSKAVAPGVEPSKKKKRTADDDDDGGLDKNFKF